MFQSASLTFVYTYILKEISFKTHWHTHVPCKIYKKDEKN